MNIYLAIILFSLIGVFILSNLARYLNLKALDPNLPDEFKGFYDEDKYRKSQEYTKTNSKFTFFSSSFDLLLILAFILLGGFNFVDEVVQGFELQSIYSGLAFFGIVYFAYDIISIPFALYSTFVIEERFGFNKMKPMTFVMDKIKSYFLTIIIGGILLGGILYFFEKTGALGWLYAWGTVSLFIFVMPPIYTTLIAPMFNKFTPLDEGELKTAIEKYTKKVKFPLTGLYVMDGSKRSTKSNAYFSGFGKAKRIALYDTLIEKHSIEELVAVLAHEVGHFKKKHVLMGTIMSIIQMGILFFLLSFFINNQSLFDAFKMENVSVYGSLIFFGILYSPISLVISILINIISRKNEYAADAFAVETTGSTEPMITGLKNLSVANLGNLTPHPLNVFINYSHPPVLERIAAISE